MNRFAASDREVVRENGLPEELINSREKILAYSGLPADKVQMFTAHLEEYKRIQGDYRADRQIRRLRGALTELFFEVYGLVARKVLQEKNPGRLYKMFLQYGYMDEELAGKESTLILYEMANQTQPEGNYDVYNGLTWLEQIRNQEKEPSVNDFGLDYQDMFREKRKRGELREEDKASYDEDLDGRMEHEIGSLFKMGQRMCCGRLNDYFPIFHQGMVIGDLSKPW